MKFGFFGSIKLSLIHWKNKPKVTLKVRSKRNEVWVFWVHQTLSDSLEKQTKGYFETQE